MKTFILLALCSAAALAAVFEASLDAEWETFKTIHNKVYGVQEEAVRHLIWEKNVRRIQKHNLEADMGKHTYWLGINKYSDMTPEEFRRAMSGFNYDTTAADKKQTSSFQVPNNVQLPNSVDWRTQGYVTPVKDQGQQCGASWAFSATGSLEGQHFKQTGNLVSLSEQNLIDCSRSFGNLGCEGGYMNESFAYIAANDGVDTEASYPYTGTDGSCMFNASNVGSSCHGSVDLPSMNETALQYAIANIGPVSVSVDATNFQQYTQGVFNDPNCSQRQVNHAVLVVGYGTSNNQDYWIVKNSWGTSWGMQGYILMSRNKNNQCGIATMASFPTVYCFSNNCSNKL